MSFNQSLLAELERESKTTKSILEKVPTENLDYKPHEKSYRMDVLQVTFLKYHHGLIL